MSSPASPIRWVGGAGRRSRGARSPTGFRRRRSRSHWSKPPMVRAGSPLPILPANASTHIGVRATTLAWSKECLLNIGIARLAGRCREDRDNRRRRHVSSPALGCCYACRARPLSSRSALGYRLRPWAERRAYPDAQELWRASGMPARPSSPTARNSGNSPAATTNIRIRATHGPGRVVHSIASAACSNSAAWARAIIIWRSEWSAIPGFVAGRRHSQLSQRRDVLERARGGIEINGKIGFVHGTIEHPFHGRKARPRLRKPMAHVSRSRLRSADRLEAQSHGVIEFAGNKPDFERAFDHYLRAREEDVNTLT